MHPNGYWENDGSGYLLKYRGSVWPIILLSQLGAKADLDSRIAAACIRYLDEALTPLGQISSSGPPSIAFRGISWQPCSILDILVHVKTMDLS